VSWLDALLLGLVEGITEFLPISSTGHLILTSSLLHLAGEAVDRHRIVIQGAAILAVCWEYRMRLWTTLTSLLSDRRAQRFAVNVFLAFIPLAVLGLLFEHQIEALLFAPIPVALALVIGGVVILWAEQRRHVVSVPEVDDLTPARAFGIGLVQALALIPGTSRAAASIIGGLFLGLSRRAATEFSFFVAIPTLLAATAYKLWEARHTLSLAEAEPLAISSIVAFVSALLSIRLLLRFVSQHSFAVFAWYRIAFGAAVLATWALGWVAW
jgi:undecaprenyl-diphosphatase